MPKNFLEKYPNDFIPHIRDLYQQLKEKHESTRKRIGRPLTLTEKILFSHWEEKGRGVPERGKVTAYLRPDRVAMQDATAQMAILQFISAGMPRVAVPTTVHCDHLIRARMGAKTDLPAALDTNREVYDFLESASQKYGMGFYKPGSGIIHQVVLEQYAFPGGLMIGTDSHTPNAGGLGMIAIGVGGADAVDVMVGEAWEVLWPKLIGIRLTGKPTGWTSGKDVILKVAGILTVKGGTGKILEYFGPGAEALSCTAKATITNMGAEIGATTSIFEFDGSMARYLRATDRAEIADLAEKYRSELTQDPEVKKNPEKFFDEIIEIDLSTLEPHIVGPHTPDLARPVSQMSADVQKNGYPADFRVALIGSCTNSSYEDIGRAAHVARQARKLGLKAKVPFLVTPGSETVRATIARDGYLADLEAIGATVLANACGPCIGQWERTDVKEGQKNSILTSYNRNFPRRNDGFASTHAFIGSPEVVTAYALTGTFRVNPLSDGIPAADGKMIKLSSPVADELPEKGFDPGSSGYVPPVEDGSRVELKISNRSERLGVLDPFPAEDKKSFFQLPVLVKAVGKCTTDHISPAGPWLKFRGHLDRISDNAFLGVNNAFSSEPGTALNVFSSKKGEKVSVVARDYKKRGVGWVVVGDENYGEGSSREHAAMSPRHLGCRVVIVRSFARIHETNLKKQGVLALTFADPADYEKIGEKDRLSFPDLDDFSPGRAVSVLTEHPDGKNENISANHTYTAEQIGWFMAGSALNLIRRQKGDTAPA